MQTVADSKELSRATVLVAAPLSILSTPEAGYPLHLQVTTSWDEPSLLNDAARSFGSVIALDE